MKQSLYDVCNFLDIEFDEERFDCLVKHPFEKFKRIKGCMKNIYGYVNNKEANSNITKQKSVFQRKHNVWINSAIEKIYNAAKRRGLRSIIRHYKNTVIAFNVC